jgi:hypothetical protein
MNTGKVKGQHQSSVNKEAKEKHVDLSSFGDI